MRKLLRYLKNFFNKNFNQEPLQFNNRLNERLALSVISATRQERINRNCKSLSDYEYRFYSQFGDDGIIEYLTSLIPNSHQRFIEFGVENYEEANTRLLLLRDNWTGLVMDGSKENIEQIRRSPDFWRYDLTAVPSFITAENINDIIVENGFSGPIGLLSIDIDGNDYWVWEALEVIKPLIVICEYNSIFGPSAPVTIPYDSSFARSKAHYSNLYAGTSLAALDHIAKQKGLRFLGCNAAGNNAYFVNESLEINLPFPSLDEGFVNSKFREALGADGKLLYKRADQCLHLIDELPVINVTSGEKMSVREALNLTNGVL